MPPEPWRPPWRCSTPPEQGRQIELWWRKILFSSKSMPRDTDHNSASALPQCPTRKVIIFWAFDRFQRMPPSGSRPSPAWFPCILCWNRFEGKSRGRNRWFSWNGFRSHSAFWSVQTGGGPGQRRCNRRWFEIVLACYLASAWTMPFGLPEPRIGLAAFGGLDWLSRSLPMKHVMEIALRGKLFDAPQAWAYGLINRVITSKILRRRLIASWWFACSRPPVRQPQTTSDAGT